MFSLLALSCSTFIGDPKPTWNEEVSASFVPTGSNNIITSYDSETLFYSYGGVSFSTILHKCDV